MALWRDDTAPVELRSRLITMRAPMADDYDIWAKLRSASRNNTAPWEPEWSSDELTRSAYRKRMRSYERAWRDGSGYPFFVFRKKDGVLLGACNLNNVRRGVLQATDIGYWIGTPYLRKGFAREAVRLIIRFGFGELGLHRIEAACRPENDASKTLLTGLGFQPEGYARQYLKIAGEWRDHEKFALLSSDPWP
tara:strand:+ start:379 stop:957 length:579 start_codon:yes stop_codon:yes gene_type:complete